MARFKVVVQVIRVETGHDAHGRFVSGYQVKALECGEYHNYGDAVTEAGELYAYARKRREKK